MIVEGIGKLYSFSARKNFANSRGYGSGLLGLGSFGNDEDAGGVWQRKKTKKGWRWSLGVYTWPTNPRTTAQQANRAKFAAGLLAWRALSADQKRILNHQAISLEMSGFNLYMRRYLNGRP